ncbi:MAG: AMP-binding protein [Candidatus Thermoplasmatota archaeon]|nr:AMP-binding protein [Candidatus Thermoplasmatota archaeon]
MRAKDTKCETVFKKDRYEELYKTFSWKVPTYYNFGFDVVDQWAEDRTKLALISIDRTGEKARYHTFYDLKVQSNQFANVLRKLRVKKGDRVLVILQSIPEWYIALIGMFKLGVVPMPGTVLLTAKDIEYRVNRSEACMIITDLDHADRVEAVQKNCKTLNHIMLLDGKRDGWLNYTEEMRHASRELSQKEIGKTRADEPLLIYFTSGTTGYPKMVLHTHSYPLGHEVTAKFAQALTKCDLHWTVSETGWAKAAWGKLFGQMIVGAAIIQWETPGRFDADGLLRAMEKYGVTTFCAPPTVYRMLIQMDLSQYKLKLRHCMSAGEPLNPEVIRVWKDAYGREIYDFFGQTETVCVLSNYSFMPIKYGSVGKPTPGHDVRIVDDDANELKTNEVGNIALYIGDIRPPGLFKEYWKDPDIMKRSFKKNYYFTGDQGYKDQDGYFWFVGRDDDIIKSSGYRIGPFEVESALIEHDAVAECAVVGAPDPEGVRGIVVKAYVVLTKGYKPSETLTKELQEHVKKVTAPYKYPRIIEYMDELPKTISGKILRRDLRSKK